MQKVFISNNRNYWPRTATLLEVPSRKYKRNKGILPSALHHTVKEFSVHNIVKSLPYEAISEEELSMILQNQTRLSLAYGALDRVPFLILKYMAEKIQILDLSHNRFRNLSFLQHFTNLQTLILDKNSNLDCQTLPVMKNLEILWINNCNIINVTEWLKTLQVQCPNLKQLSMMCNPVGWTVLNGVSEHDEKEYLTQILKVLPNLEYFDGIRINDELRRLAFGRKKICISFLERTFKQKLTSFVNFSTKFQKRFMSIDKLNAHFIAKDKSL